MQPFDLQDWPLRETSRYIETPGMHWHVQQMGQGPALLLLHGTGASTHSWRALIPALARSFTVIACDLPGHGFTSMPPPAGLSLPCMSAAVATLMRAIDVAPQMVVGHSAGAAILIEAALDGLLSPRAIVSINGALLPLGSVAGRLFSPMAKVMAASRVTAQFMAWRAHSRAAVERVLRGTGSRLEPEGIDLYARLFRNPDHVAAALGMMARWDLDTFASRLPDLKVPLVLVAAGEDKAVDPDDAFKVRDVVANAEVEYLPGLGHLAHEERPQPVVAIIERVARRVGILPTP